MLLNCGIGDNSWESLDCKEIKPVNLKGNQPWIFIGRTDAEAEAPIIWPPDAKSQLIGKDPNAGKDWRQEEKRTTEDEMVECHHWLNGHELRQTLGDGDRWEAWCAIVHGVSKSQTWLGDRTGMRTGFIWEDWVWIRTLILTSSASVNPTDSQFPHI